MARFTKEEIELLKKYVTDPEGDIFAIKNMDGMAGAAYARYSRAKGGFREVLLNEFIKEGHIDPKHADQLIERILIAFGDDSVGELEGVHVSLENISNLAAKEIEDRRIGGSPIEQSSRYVFYDQKDENGGWRYLREKKIMDSEHASEYVAAMDFFFKTYCDLIEPMTAYFGKQKPLEVAEYDIRGNGEKQRWDDLSDEERPAFERTYKFDLKTKTCDTLRSLLPAATLTNVGMFGNGRFFQGLISHLLTKNVAEFNEIGKKLFSETSKLIPQYVRRARKSEYTLENSIVMFKLADSLLNDITPETAEQVTLLLNPKNEKEFDEQFIAQMLYAFCHHPISQLRKIVAKLPKEKRDVIVATYYGDRKTRRDRPGRALEFGYPLTFDLIGDFGAYRDIQRHRMCTQERQRLSPHLGFNMPHELIEAGFEKIVGECVDRSAALYDRLVKEFPEEAQYAILFGFNIRWNMGMNDREAMHLLELRTVAQGHPSYRKLCQEMHRAIAERSPWRAALMKFVDYNDYYWSRGDSEARQRVKEKKLEEKIKAEKSRR
ncbi:MAG: FAD-dependent thymidylate synthase [Patescibacteria group bacterium]